MSSQLKLVDITKKFEANTVNEKVALDHLNLTVEPGQLCRRNDGLHGHGHGRHGRPRRFRCGTEPLQHGAADAAASADAAAARTERLEMQLRCNGNGQILPRMRRKETRTQARRRKLEMQLWGNGNGQILSGVRRKETRTCTGRLDLHLRKGQQR